MTFSIYKVVNKQVWLINACPSLKTYISELIPGSYLKKLQQGNLLTEIDAETIIETLFMFDEITFEIEQARFFACIDINSELQQNIQLKNLQKHILKNTAKTLA